MSNTILVTGASGYIGSHTCVELLGAGYRVLALDNLSNSSQDAMRRVERLVGRPVPFVQADVRDRGALDELFRDHAITGVIHFAGLKAVGESVAEPLSYYKNNVAGSITLLEAMAHANVKRILFSSSATVYGDPEVVPIKESARLGATNPYGRSKLMIEEVINDLVRSDPEWRAGILRYFNPVGAHASGAIGEDPRGIPNNLAPYLAQVASGRRPKLQVFGADYPTPDGTGVRGYIHVVDLAQGHIAALNRLSNCQGSFTVNLGTGRGYSVFDFIRAFEHASGRTIPFEVVPRRPGDIATCFATSQAAYDLLGWRANKCLEEMCEDLWRWQSSNPNGYAS